MGSSVCLLHCDTVTPGIAIYNDEDGDGGYCTQTHNSSVDICMLQHSGMTDSQIRGPQDDKQELDWKNNRSQNDRGREMKVGQQPTGQLWTEALKGQFTELP